MIISSSQMVLTGKNRASTTYVKNESLEVWGGNGNQSNQGTNNPGIQDQVKGTANSNKISNSEFEEAALTSQDRIRLKIAEILFEKATGKKIRINIPSMKKISSNAAPVDNIQGWGMEYNFTETTTEKEAAAFQAKGTVKTADGREIDISMNLKMSRSFVESNNINIQAGEAKLVDPLVINFSGNSAQLTDTKFDFDLDSDGKTDKISFVDSGSGFLTLDINKNGTVDDGSELFGPSTGNGFLELAQYDDDGNQWIDEADSIFDKLHIWTKDAEGNDRLFALPEKDVGAIYLGKADVNFSYKNEENQLLGAMKSAGIYLKESGQAGVVQQVDLAV